MSGYDPDRTNADDLDPTDHDAVTAWLDHPNTHALHDDLGRASREEPADVQIRALEQLIATDQPRLDELTEMLATREYEPAARAALDQLQATMANTIAQARARIAELSN